jgi:hypothetical protein
MNPQVTIPRKEIEAFCRAHSVRSLAIFGSAVRPDFNEDRDIDVLIDLDPNTRIGLIALQKMRDELAGIFGPGGPVNAKRPQPPYSSIHTRYRRDRTCGVITSIWQLP